MSGITPDQMMNAVVVILAALSIHINHQAV